MMMMMRIHGVDVCLDGLGLDFVCLAADRQMFKPDRWQIHG